MWVMSNRILKANGSWGYPRDECGNRIYQFRMSCDCKIDTLIKVFSSNWHNPGDVYGYRILFWYSCD